jgi:hypothetical protein
MPREDTNILLRIPTDQVAALDDIARKLGISRASQVRDLIAMRTGVPNSTGRQKFSEVKPRGKRKAAK